MAVRESLRKLSRCGILLNSRLHTDIRHCVENKLDKNSFTTGIFISDKCVKQIKEIGETESYLRVMVEGGGCSGFQCKFELDNQINEDDRMFEKDGVKVIIDCTSLEFLKGATIDYHEELIKSSFSVTNNPQAEKGAATMTARDGDDGGQQLEQARQFALADWARAAFFPLMMAGLPICR